jgi:hypothetical protein
MLRVGAVGFFARGVCFRHSTWILLFALRRSQ